MRKVTILVLLVLAGVVLYVASPAPARFTAADLPEDYQPDAARGRVVYDASGCHSCHASATSGDPRPIGGKPFATPLGTFYPPNLTPDRETGLGDWSALDLANALMKGTGRSGAHLVPALPYLAYRNMALTDILDLDAYLKSLEPVKNAVPTADIPGLALARPMIGWWKLLAFDTPTFREDETKDQAWNLGAYLVQGLGHCGECHTPRNLLMIPDQSRELAGGPHPDGHGNVPSLRGLIERGKYKSVSDLADALEYGESFGYDGMSSGGMGAVQQNLSKLPRASLEAIATYLASLKPLPEQK
jgi:mono/diheme cytochrome c family protein